MRLYVSAHGLLLMVALLLPDMNCLKICSYNIPQFNKAKSSDSRVVNTLTRILSRCDVSLLLGVRELAALDTLLASLNRYSKKYKYKSVSSKALGTDTKNLEHYTFIYRTQTVKLTGQHQYQTAGFVRPPFVVRFQSDKTKVPEFVLIPLHSEPTKAVQEIDKLYDVFREVYNKWKNQNVMLLGDFHAGCAYMTRIDKKRIRLFSNTSFSWLITDRVDTTVTEETHCPYDRMVVYGESFLKQIVPFSAKVFNPMKALKVRSSQMMQMSNHYPLEVVFKSSVTSLLHSSPLYFLLLILHFLHLTL